MQNKVKTTEIRITFLYFSKILQSKTFWKALQALIYSLVTKLFFNIVLLCYMFNSYVLFKNWRPDLSLHIVSFI